MKKQLYFFTHHCRRPYRFSFALSGVSSGSEPETTRLLLGKEFFKKKTNCELVFFLKEYAYRYFDFMKFLENDWGWAVETTPPFLAFRALRRRATEKYGEAAVLDLSQGEPGYGFAPSTRSRRFFSFLMLIDTVLNNNQTNEHFGEKEESNFDEGIFRRIAFEYYTPDIANILLQDLEEFLQELQYVTQAQKMPKSRFEILYDIFKYSIISGGRYPNSWGEMILRMVIAEERTKEFGFPVSFEDIVVIAGASQGVGAFFKGMGAEGCGFLQPGDTVLMISPVYAPYTQFVESRGLRLVNIAVHAETGVLDETSFTAAKNHSERIKAIILVDPNNPSGFSLSPDILQRIAEVADAHNALILTDEVYAEFFPGNTSIVQLPEARKRTIRLNALSKIERGTGIRVGDMYIAPEAREFITREIIEPVCPGFTEKYNDIRWFLFLAKSSGGSTIGVFQHISGVPGPSQILGLTHLVLGKKERAEYVQKLQEKVENFYKHVEVPYPGNRYYGVLDLRKIEGPLSAQKPIEQVLTEIAEKGVVLMPAYKFFSETDRVQDDRRRYIRVSLPNLSLANTAKAARILREHVQE